ncbi:P-loop containing nucleoside triphosphate hydrolase [Lasallia pustulata]|uniref:DNA repair protein RAD50 n=1 Tax=Lasallia pustulata TaxID=136370 RepID=A0A1W5CS44_9LECA|nr:P-loop containing nucleoside triphosphate hydrolase [Lasallia pustulata]
MGVEYRVSRQAGQLAQLSRELPADLGKAKIDKLSILGVRSFDNTRSETIQFSAPLTLIVGYNGSGKTTIIECLKYATTGDLPPNSKGGAFIHDPKLCGEKEVLAQVKLSFKATTGAKMVATRSLQLTVKKTTRQQKTLEGQLLMIKDGERTAISSRVAELDQIMPQYLGVSKAVLDSVIFCHQDESLWPMSEPSVLKKKFDEIFEALKYTKAIDNIKALRKKQTEELGKYEIHEKNAKENKDKGERAEKRSQQISDEIEVLRAETHELSKKAQDAKHRAQEAWDQGAAYEHVVATLKNKQNQQEWLQKDIDDLQHDIEERTESDDWLQAELDQYEERVAAHEEHRKRQTRRYDDLRREIDQVRGRQAAKRTEAGKYEQMKAHHEQQIQRREMIIKETARRHNIRGYDADLDDMQINEYMDRISKLWKAQNTSVDRLRRETDKEVQKVQSVLSNLGERRSALQESKSSIKQHLASNDQKVGSCQTQLNKVEIDEGTKAAVESHIEDLETKMKQAKRDLEIGAWDSKIQQANAQVRSFEDESERLNRELIQGTKQAGELARLDHLKKEVKDHQRSLDTMVGAHGERLRNIVGQKWQPSSLEGEFQAVIDQRKRHLVDAERHREGVTRELEQVDFKLKSNRADLKKKQAEFNTCAQHIVNATQGEPEDYPENLLAFKHDRDVRKGDVEGYSILKKWYNECIEVATEKEACRLCARPFGNKKELSQFIMRLEKQLSKGALDGMQKELRDLEADLQRARDAGSSYDSWLRLKEKELPTLEAETEKQESQKELLLRQIEEHDKTVNDRAEASRDAETLVKPVANIVKYTSEVVNLQRQIEQLAAAQKDAGLSRTLEEVKEQLDSITDKSRTLRGSIAKLTSEKERSQRQITALELSLKDAKTNLTTTNFQLKEKANLLAQIEELKKLNHEGREARTQVDAEIQKLAPQIAEEETKLEDIKQRGSTKEKELQREASQLSDSVHKLELADQDIRTYLDDGGPEKLARADREIQSLQQEIEQLGDEQRQITVEINKIGEELKNHQQTKRTIADNITFRRKKRELQAVEDEIIQLSAQNAEADLDHHKSQADHWQRRYIFFSTEQKGKMATMKAKDDQLQELLKDWETDYKDAPYNFKEAHILVETTKAVVEDLGRYGGALDKAIMKYHSLKMEEINRIAEELWKKTYQGTDVDTVLIRSDNETGKGNRSYNYRVCMVKQDAEMDMRGRCSAGQKVLASIIIRLALAECFGVNCGLIALDEPTTNLDRDNIRSLAESLHDIINSRRQQSNFQLIVITHDEDFLRYMKCADFCDNYWRVSRNDRQKSVIERQSIADVM